MSTAVEPQRAPPRSPQADSPPNSPPKRLSQVEAALSALHTPAHERTEAQIAALVTWCRVNNLGSALGGSVNLDLLCRAMKAEEYEEDHVLFRQGDAGSVYYIVFSGEISLYVNTTLSALNTILKPAAQTAVLGSRLMRGLRTSQSAKAGGARGCAVSATAAPTSERPPAAAAAAPPAAGTGRRGSCRSAIAAAALGSSASLLSGRSSSPHAAAPAAAPAEKGQAQEEGQPRRARPSSEAAGKVGQPRRPSSDAAGKEGQPRRPSSEAAGSTSKPASPPPRRRTSLSGAAIVGLPVEAPISKEEAARLEAAKLGKCVHTATAGTGFGDLALISSQPRAAGAVVRNGPCMLLAIRREAYDSIVKAEAAKALRQKVALMRNGLTLTP